MKPPLLVLLAGLALVGCQTPETTPTKSAPVAAPAKVVPAQRNLAVGPTPESVTKGFGGKYFVTLMGAEKAREQARALVDQAVLRLASYGSEADILRALARYIVERDR